MHDWPWPHTRLQRHDFIASLYRDALAEHAPKTCQQLDDDLDHFGQHWITGNKPPLNPEEPMTAAQLAIWLDTKINNITKLIASRNIQPTELLRKGRKTYWLADFPQKLGVAV